jgi:hypothetical protein
VLRADSSYTLIVNGDSRAVLTVELTFTLPGEKNRNELLANPPHRYWRDLPEQFNSVTELHSTYSSESKETHTTNSQIMVVWSPAKLVDWHPKSIPKEAMLSIASDPFKTERREVFTLQGSKLSHRMVLPSGASDESSPRMKPPRRSTTTKDPR